MVTRAISITLLAALAVSVLFLSLGGPCAGQPGKGPAIAPDPKIQEMLRQFVRAKDEADAQKAKKSINEMARTMPEVLVPQIIYYELHATSQEDVGILSVMGHISRAWGSQTRTGLLPLLESGDKKTHETAYGYLGGVDGFHSPGFEHNIWSYRDAILRQKKAPPPGLVDYLFFRGQSTSLLFFGQIYSDDPNLKEATRPLEWSDHVITTVKWRIEKRFVQEGDMQKAQKELDDLSKHDGWYARRYVVSIMHGTPKLRVPEIVNRLVKDPNPLVAGAAKFSRDNP